MLVRGQDVAKICAIKNILEGRQNAYPDCRPIVARNIPAKQQLATILYKCDLVLPQDPNRASSQDPYCGAGMG